jgi:hypothetical protein
VRELNALLHREERDVGRLEGLTIDSVLARLKGLHDRRGRVAFLDELDECRDALLTGR